MCPSSPILRSARTENQGSWVEDAVAVVAQVVSGGPLRPWPANDNRTHRTAIVGSTRIRPRAEWRLCINGVAVNGVAWSSEHTVVEEVAA